MNAQTNTELSRELEDNGFYAALMHLHRQDHDPDNCFCTTEVSGAYKTLLAITTALIEQKQIEAREQTAQTILEHLQSRPIHEHIEYLEAEIMMMEAANAKAKV